MLALEQSMKSFWFTAPCCTLIVGILCISGCPALTQGASDSGPQLPNNSHADRSAAQLSLAAIESDLRHQLDRDPQSAPLLFRLGQVLLRENKPKDSLEIYTRAARQQQPDAEQLR